MVPNTRGPLANHRLQAITAEIETMPSNLANRPWPAEVSFERASACFLPNEAAKNCQIDVDLACDSTRH
jgi:hypothetical protein